VRTRDWFFDIKGFRVGFQSNRVYIDGKPYLDRYIVYLGGTLRAHRFWRGDDDTAVHDHPWDFWTFPLADYVEQYEEFVEGTLSWRQYTRVVKAFRFNKRLAEFRHIVLGKLDKTSKWRLISKEPFWTIVVTKPRKRSWFFYPEPFNAIPWREYGEHRVDKNT
jgi:hypothetical protein